MKTGKPFNNFCCTKFCIIVNMKQSQWWQSVMVHTGTHMHVIIKSSHDAETSFTFTWCYRKSACYFQQHMYLFVLVIFVFIKTLWFSPASQTVKAGLVAASLPLSVSHAVRHGFCVICNLDCIEPFFHKLGTGFVYTMTLMMCTSILDKSENVLLCSFASWT